MSDNTLVAILGVAGLAFFGWLCSLLMRLDPANEPTPPPPTAVYHPPPRLWAMLLAAFVAGASGAGAFWLLTETTR